MAKTIFSICVFVLLSIISCKKENKPATCGCDAPPETGQRIQSGAIIAYNQTASKWFVSVNSNGFFYNYYICNPSQDSVRRIIQSGNTSNVYNVNFTGQSRLVCDGESFGWTQGNVSEDYIWIESISRR
jgi:hypothetical protein